MVFAYLRKSVSLNLFPKGAALFLRERHSSFLLQHHFVTTGNPDAFEHQPAGDTKTVASLLKENGFSVAQLEKVFRSRPQLCSANWETSINPKIKIFQEFGFSSSEIAKIITKEPTVLCCRASKLRPSLSTLLGLLGCRGAVVNLLGMGKNRRFLSTDFEKTLYPNIEFLKSHGLSMQRINGLMRLFPAPLFLKHELLTKLVEKLERLGFNPSSSKFIYGLWAVASMGDEIWEQKLRTFRDLGFTDSDTLTAFRKVPLALTTSSEKIKRITQVVLSTKSYTMSDIIAFPVCFRCSLEKRLKPRLQVLQILEKKKLIKKWPSLTVIYAYTDKRFHKSFVAPHRKSFTGKIESTLLDAK